MRPTPVFFVLLLLLAVHNSSAQNKPTAPNTYRPGDIFKNTYQPFTSPVRTYDHKAFIQNHKAITAQKSTSGLYSRLIAEAKFTHLDLGTLELHDTLHYFYSGWRYGDLSSDYIMGMEYDSAYEFRHAVNNLFPEDKVKTMQVLDNNDNVLARYRILVDNTTMTLIDSMEGWIRTYDGNNNILTHSFIYYNSGQWDTAMRRTYTYDGNNNMLTLLEQNCYAQVWENFYRNTFEYDNNNRLIKSYYEQWTNNSWVNGGYDSTSYNNDDSIIYWEIQVWDNVGNSYYPIRRNHIQYNNNGCPYYTWTEQYINNTWQETDRRGTSYHGNTTNIATDTGSYYDQTLGYWVIGNIYQYNNYLAIGCPEEMIVYGEDEFGDIQTIFHTLYGYNNYNQPVSAFYMDWSDTDGDYVETDNTQLYLYYYEEYGSLGLNNAGYNNCAITLYPIPASKNLSIELVLQKPQILRFSICDISGKTVQTWEELSSMQYKKNIALDGIAPGNYLLTVAGNEGKVVKKFTIADN